MRTLIYSDVHGNLPAFEKMLKAEEKYESYVCLGDLVNYGPWSNECVELANSLYGSTIIMGNHEEAFINGYYPGENALVKEFFNITYKEFSLVEEIKKFKRKIILNNFTCTHTILDKYIYPDTDIELTYNCIIGHSHHQFEYKNNGYVLYNAGSVGQNRKFIDTINYLIYDWDQKSITMKAMPYDIKPLINEMKNRGYSDNCMAYYLSKKRANLF
ncbi:metallophosphoesterase family protein [Pedobacter chitinilyticus]|uniref:Metallophosphoesterase n=1 Tax=Pedobacter chitinilyticus TaxID=2233776 RepID=A0A443YNV3_9SPHI|nr:metallophosphoesterase [Pedobacter chitinilyticus]RWU05460.1 metallophosphoesterase [Pedobacter chitinilyticus]